MSEPGKPGKKERQAEQRCLYAIMRPIEKGFGHIHLAPEKSFEKVLDGIAEFWLGKGNAERYATASIYGISGETGVLESEHIEEVYQKTPAIAALMAKIEAEKLEKAAEAAEAPSRRIGPRL